MDNKLRLLMQLIKNGDLGGGSSATLSAAGTFDLEYNDAEVTDLDFDSLGGEWPTDADACITFLHSLIGKQVYADIDISVGKLSILAQCDYDDGYNTLYLATSLGTIEINLDTTDYPNYTFNVNWDTFLSLLVSANPTLAGNEEYLQSLSVGGVNYEISDKATRIGYLTTAPTAPNYNGLIFVVLNSEPAQRYDGYIYIITSEQEI